MITPIREVLRKIKSVWARFTTPLKVGSIGCLLVGVLLTLKIAGILNVHWVWFYGLPLTLFLAMFVAVIIHLMYQLWDFVKNLYNGEL